MNSTSVKAADLEKLLDALQSSPETYTTGRVTIFPNGRLLIKFRAKDGGLLTAEIPALNQDKIKTKIWYERLIYEK